MHITYVKIEVLMPEGYIALLRNKLNEAAVIRQGNYDHVISYSFVHGYWRPLEGAEPFEGEEGEISHGTECLVTFKTHYNNVSTVKGIIEDIHPYEEPVYYVIPLMDV
ncbi:divalent cation tolerance protein CutA [Salipaludibacillus sp. LMS25]|uniref:divalent cation tolerance protein CutA n=1 Tax=Salipaludibacillus sp. LMS25 TaxID=2924031 RepID=UPI0020D095AC|nr:divalent cation tolerance protein CutA [Salipaludibacillus sp. LMS25]UTR13221.1 divalent cation tolerance protein CutA [Salipaludibacillus sp. LMS25]